MSKIFSTIYILLVTSSFTLYSMEYNNSRQEPAQSTYQLQRKRPQPSHVGRFKTPAPKRMRLLANSEQRAHEKELSRREAEEEETIVEHNKQVHEGARERYCRELETLIIENKFDTLKRLTTKHPKVQCKYRYVTERVLDLGQLSLALYYKRFAIFKYLLKNASVRQKTVALRDFILFYDEQHHSPRRLFQLLQAGANPDANIIGIKKRTALHLAVYLKKPDLVRELLDHGADPTKMDSDGKTAEQLITDAADPASRLMKGYFARLTDEARLLVAFATNNQAVIRRYEPNDPIFDYLIHRAVKMHLTNALSTMLSYGLNPFLKDHPRETATYYADHLPDKDVKVQMADAFNGFDYGTAIILAAGRGAFESIPPMLNAKNTDVNTTLSNKSVLKWARDLNAPEEILEKLKQKGADDFEIVIEQ